jgi:hypothetical protein
MLRLLRVMGFRNSVRVPPLGHTKGESFHEDKPARRFENRGRFDNFNLQGNFEIFDSK